MKIISGGQTGVDRGALDAALEVGIECGGTCPAGRKAEDGVIPAKYPLTEFDSTIYSDRTRQNVVDSDATLIIHFGQLEGGTAFTRQCCLDENRPFLVLDASESDESLHVQQVLDFIHENSAQVLNVAGPRASKVPTAHDFTLRLLVTALQRP
jgi:predicted Rossmann fold nucleotide-binding protein DprA/Smf involved in DNA uptake